jgi:protein-tyrosine phosphatase
MYWVIQDEGRRLAIAPRPRGGDWLRDEILRMRTQGIEHLVSTLTRWEVPDLALEAEAEVCARCGVAFYRFSVEDRGVPESMLATQAFLGGLLSALRRGQGVAVHGRSGLGRAPTLVGALMLLDGWQAQDIWDRLAQARGAAIPATDAQRAWLFDFAHMLRATRGSL